MRTVIAICLFLGHVAFADMYLQSPPGSNNRLDEANRDRNNGNRCFDSQNNNRGGYNVGKLIYYQGEAVKYSWTNQHSSGKYQMGHTEVVIQVACEAQIRDGTSRRTPPDAPTQCINFDCDNDVRYCRHESYNWYQMCKATARNLGLFTANQNLQRKQRNGRHQRHSAKYTRQNPQGTRRGYECPEERDYYPYWRQSPWVDVAYIGADDKRCAQVQANSDNVKDKGYCKPAMEYWTKVQYARGRNGEFPNDQASCDNSSETFSIDGTPKGKKFAWAVQKAHGVAAPVCSYIPTSRANHHGLIQNSNEMMTFEWVVPSTSTMSKGEQAFWATKVTDPNSGKAAKQCVMRLRYNITTDDYQAWESDSSINAGLDYKNNSQERNSNADKDPAWVKIWEKYGLTYDDVWCNWDRNPDSSKQTQCRGYVFRNNPRVDPFNLPLATTPNATRVQLQLAINTNQFGRTFQDRTHTFYIHTRPASGMQGNALPADANIYSVMARGKRGNIVQVYPATEYFYHPEGAQFGGAIYQEGSFLHIHVPGSNTNPNNNDGQGKRGTDRTNFCPITDATYGGAAADPAGYRAYCGGNGIACQGVLGNSYAKRLTNEPYTSLGWAGPMQNKYAYIRTVFDSTKSGLSWAVWKEICMLRQNLGPSQDNGNMEELDDSAANWRIPPVKIGGALKANDASEVRTGYLCTRNNNFSNRSQKGALVVSDQIAPRMGMASISGSVFQEPTGVGGVVIVAPGMTIGPMAVVFSSNPKKCSMMIDFDQTQMASGGWVQLMIPCEPVALNKPQVMKSDGAGGWAKASKNPKKGFRNGQYMTVVSITSPGTYKVTYEADPISIAAVVLGSVAFCCAVAVACGLRMTK